MTDAVGYVRLSMDRHGDELGVENQERAVREWADARGITITRMYRDNDVSATTGVIRPQFEQLLKDKPDVVVCWHSDRFVRVARDLERVLSLGMTDLLFALDSIPAIYGLTKEPYLVFTANVFALMGLRQLYFLIGGLLQRLVYLSYGLAFLLAFIGVKLILHALHENEVPFINGGEPVEWAPDIPIWLSLLVIIGTLAVTTMASLAKDARDKRAAGQSAE